MSLQYLSASSSDKAYCQYCGKAACLVGGDIIYPHRPDLSHKKFWQCKPCDAYVGCHAKGAWFYQHGIKVVSDGTVPLGRLANSELRAAKQAVHAVLDLFWQEGGFPRKAVYRNLAHELGITEDECHVGMFDVAMCERAEEICTRWRFQS